MPIGLSELISALVGAAATGAFGVYDRRSERAHSKASLTKAIKANVQFLTELIRSQGYWSDAAQIVTNSELPNWDGALLTIDAAGEYLQGISACTARAGELDGEVAEKLVEFSLRAQLFLDSTKSTGTFVSSSSLDERRSHAIETYNNIGALLSVGDWFAQKS